MRKRSAVLAGFFNCCFLLSLAALLSLDIGCGEKSNEPAEKGDPDYLITQGDLVKVQYKGSLEDGTVFDESREGAPLEFTVGSGQLISGFEQGVVGMKLNEEKTVTIPADQAYGPANPKLIRTVPRTFFAPDFNPELGQEIPIMTQSGRTLRGVLVEATEDSLRIDFNHKLAGKALTCDIKVIAIE